MNQQNIIQDAYIYNPMNDKLMSSLLAFEICTDIPESMIYIEGNPVKILFLKKEDIYMFDNDDEDYMGSILEYGKIVLFAHLFNIEKFHLTKEFDFVYYENPLFKNIEYEFPRLVGLHSCFYIFEEAILGLNEMFKYKLISLNERNDLIEESREFLLEQQLIDFPHFDKDYQRSLFEKLKNEIFEEKERMENFHHEYFHM
ncbi:020L [Cherax quadricarinatus iridovirus]|uniref:Uncharacterized protein n=1 Tax=Shrimp hemocyte iridescent virus TaxID=2039780 RepID=A0A291B0Y3_9VIRU|nr:020L [Cherax quadricarinatus iridovirus]YP_010084883.1 hypothetical protein KM509_gp131 [Shrimp hemocyte iridescent virus]UPA43339.1 hypothetical protein 4TH000065 [Iridovirus CN01]ASZ85000.1 020L [Cherax quadricarinatus iridovirus]ATE87140.1 hypothetical protein [Shrimp hemocyte iridescent virus]UPA43574.1 hypothetical protein 3TG000141 [Iridovirus CN01]UPA43609.1 hypothetical protein 1DG000017 [Iridovirus CN01]